MPSRLFLGNLSFRLTDEELARLFVDEQIPVDSVRMVRDPDTGRSRGFAFAELPAEADMAAAIQKLNGKMVDGRALTVSEARAQKRRAGEGGGFGARRDRPGKGPRGGNPPRRRPPDLY